MKKGINLVTLLKVFIIMIFVLSSADGVTANKKKNRNQNNTQEREVMQFNAIASSSSVDVFITQGSSESIKVVADEKVINKIITEVRESVLYIYTKNLKFTTGKMAVYVTLKELKGLKITGSGDVSSENIIKAKDLKFAVTGSGDMKIDLNANNVDGQVTGSGDVKLSGITGVLKIRLSGSGDFNADALGLDQCEISLSGSGDIRLSGMCKELNMTGSSSGDISASKLDTKVCRITKTGSGDVSVLVRDDLYVKLTGSGDVYYKGDPSVNAVNSGSGNVRRY